MGETPATIRALGDRLGRRMVGRLPEVQPDAPKCRRPWLRLFPEWQVIQPRKGEWNWKAPDAMVANARDQQHPAMVVLWAYLAPWASADGGTRKFPIKDIRYWRDYVSGTVSHYKEDIKYWEVWNEFNGSFGDSKNKVKDYAELVVAAYDAAKKVDPEAKIGMSVANFDVGFLDAVIKAGAADHFDFICVHPYENLGAVAEGGRSGLSEPRRQSPQDARGQPAAGGHPALDHRDRLPGADEGRAGGRRKQAEHAGQGVPPLDGPGIRPGFSGSRRAGHPTVTAPTSASSAPTGPPAPLTRP